MDLRRWPNADSLLDEALTLPRAERPAFLRRVAGYDAELLAALEAVVAEDGHDDRFLSPGGALGGELGDDVREMLDAGASRAHALSPGTCIEQYEVVELIGRGGMGEVYRARDTRLQRDVALKVLPGIFADDEERLARFRREARVLALLSHPAIGSIYGVAEGDGIEALVLELVEGPTLSERLAAGPLSLDEVVTIGRSLAEAIAAAHVRGILHRDLKPANIKVLPGGGVKILDFGLAKAMAGHSRAESPDLTVAESQMMLGTAAYMSPEQVRGAAVDARADIWAFGCILFEMLTGSPAFAGPTAQEVLARVIERDPPYGLVPPGTPPSIRRLLRRTLEKDPDRRLGFIGDALLEFDDAATEGTAPQVEPRPASRVAIAALVAAALVLGLAAGVLLPWRAATSSPLVARFVIPLNAGETPVTGYQPMVALSPDGRTLVYRVRHEGVERLFRRALHELHALPIPGTEQATSPFFSPDGRWLGFDSDGVLKRVSLAGGLPAVIAPAPGGATATWAPDDTIIFATNTGRVLQRVPASGGPAEPLTTLDAARGDTLHLLPQALADGRTVLFTIAAGAARHIAALDLATREVRLIAEGSHGRLLPSGHLLFSRQGVLWAGAVDTSRLMLTSQAVPRVEGIAHTDHTVLHFDVSRDGSLVYLPAGQTAPGLQRLVWIDRDGRETPAGIEPGPYTRVSLAPDGTRIAIAIADGSNTDVWVADPGRGTMGRLTVDPTIETMPTWSPDGRYVAFRSEREGPGVFQRDAQGAGPIERLTTTDGPIHSPYSWTPDGRTLLIALFRSFSRQAIASVTPPDPTVRVLLDGEYAQLDPHVSPDGRWMAYQSSETGQFEIYVRPYPDIGAGRWQVSTSGGTSPRWSPDGRELYYYDGAGLMVVAVPPGARFAGETPRRLFTIRAFGGRLGPDYEVAPDGRRFLFILETPVTHSTRAELVFVQHWAVELGGSGTRN